MGDYRASDEDYQVPHVRARPARQYDPTAPRQHLLNRVSTEDVSPTPVVLCSFGMKSKATVFGGLRSTLQLSAASIHHVRS